MTFSHVPYMMDNMRVMLRYTTQGLFVTYENSGDEGKLYQRCEMPERII